MRKCLLLRVTMESHQEWETEVVGWIVEKIDEFRDK